MTSTYAERAARHGAHGDAERRRSRLVSWLRLATILPGLAALVWGLAHVAHGGLPAVAAGIVLLLAYGGLVVWHARIEDRAAWFDALRLVNERALARTERRWDALPPAEAPPSIDLPHHPYALDLDLFGRASLFQFLGPAATPQGRGTLARWLVGPAPPAEILERQGAVLELAARHEWRERLAAHGVLAGDIRRAEIDPFLEWAEGPNPFPRSRVALQVLAIVLPLTTCILLALFFADVMDAAVWLIPLTIGIVLSFVTSKTIAHEFDRAGVGQYGLSRYAHLFRHATGEPFDAPPLGAIRERLGANRGLERRVAAGGNRRVERADGGRAPLAADLVADAVHHRAAQVGLQRALPSRLEMTKVGHAADERVLDQIVGVGKVARPLRQPAGGPAGQPWQVAIHQAIERGSIPGANALEQDERRRGGRVLSCRRPRGRSVFQSASFG